MEIDHIRDIDEFINLYNTRPMPNQYELEFLINNPNLFCFYDEEEGFLRGFITIQREEFKELDGQTVLTLSGTSIRKNMADNIQAIIKICNAFDDDMYSYTPLKHAALVLKKAGFEKLKDKIFVRYNNGKQ